jgi:hypothetical protein
MRGYFFHSDECEELGLHGPHHIPWDALDRDDLCLVEKLVLGFDGCFEGSLDLVAHSIKDEIFAHCVGLFNKPDHHFSIFAFDLEIIGLRPKAVVIVGMGGR